MVRFIDAREREEEILGLIVENYIKESRPISSAYLCQKCHLNYSSATVRNVMLSLEKKGLLSHIHTSSGRVPTKEGFKYYVEHFSEEDMVEDYPLSLDFDSLPSSNIEEIVNCTLDTLTQTSGYTSLVAISGSNEKIFFRGMRFILEQPEFEDISRLKTIFYALEVRMQELQQLLFNCIDEKVRILIGDDIGFEEISDCSLIASGLRANQFEFALGLLGPMRMNYAKAASCLNSVRNQLKDVVEEFV
jgi:transcriptional regulator of heat shock response